MFWRSRRRASSGVFGPLDWLARHSPCEPLVDLALRNATTRHRIREIRPDSDRFTAPERITPFWQDGKLPREKRCFDPMHSGELKAKDWLAERIGFELRVTFFQYTLFNHTPFSRKTRPRKVMHRLADTGAV
jgi:hypothetical protein